MEKFSIPFAILLGSLMQNGNCLHYPQYYQAFSYSHCMGPATNLFETNTDIPGTGDAGMKLAKSVATRGLWKHDYGGDSGNITVIQRYLHGRKSCFALTLTENVDMLPWSAINLLPADIDDSALGLYRNEDFDGDFALIKASDNNISFDEPFVAGSWAFNGPRNFSLFEGSNFTGQLTCLVVDDPDVIALGWGMTVSWDAVNLIVGSVRRDCDVAKASEVLHGSPRASKIIDQKGKEVSNRLYQMPKTVIATSRN